MPSKPVYNWPIRMAFRTWGKKPAGYRLPGLSIGAMGRYPDGTRVWSFCLEGLLAN